MTSRTALPANPFRAPERALPLKTRLDEYEIERVLAQSSFSVVYRAYDHALKLHVAIKEYLPDALALRSADTQVVLRARSHAERFELGLQAFVDEAQTLARCEHPALIRISRILLRHGTAYRVMRYCPGPTLLEHRRELGATPEPDALRGWLDQLLGAMEALHEEGCVHAAVAPGNILLLPGGRPMLLDFDAVRTALISDRTQSMMTALEPCFEPIEQRAPDAAMSMGPWTDLYALAATLHFCISGQLPAPPAGLGAGQAFEPLAPVWQRLRAGQPGLGQAPPWLGALDHCLREVPAARPQSVAQLRSLLEAGAPAAPSPLQVPLPVPPQAPLQTSLHTPLQSPPVGVPVLHLAAEVAPLAARPAVATPVAQSAAPPTPRAAPVPPKSPAQPATPAVAAAAAPTGPARAPMPSDASHAKVMADLDKTFAFIAAHAHEEAAPGTPESTKSAAVDSPAGPKPLTRQQLWMAGAVVVLMLAAMAGMVGWWVKENRAMLVGSGQLGAVQSAVASPTTPPAAAPALVTLDTAPPAAGPGTRMAAAPPAGEPKAGARKARPPPPASPREACGERTRFALYQCMQTQCAKPAWTKHAQCVRLRKEQKLG